MADVNTLIDEFITKLSLDDDVSAKAAAIAAVLDRLTKSAESAGAAVLGAGSAAENAGAKVAAQAAAWDRLAARQDAVTAATVKLAAAQEELARTQQLAAAALSQGGDQDQVNRVLEKQISNIERLKATLVAVRDAQEGATQANTAWTSSIEKGDELLSGLAISAKATADSFIRGSAEAAVYGQSLDALRARFDSVFRTTKDYEAELALLNQAFALGAIKGPMAQARALDELNAKYSQTTGTTEALAAAQVAAAAAAQKQADAWQTLGASITSLNSKIEAQRASYDSVYRVSKQYQAQVDAMTDDLNRNRISQEQFNIFLDKANASMANATRTTKAYSDGHGQAAFATRQLGVQTVQFFSSLESGIPFMTALVEQGHQLVDVALSTGTGFEVVGNAIKSAFGAMISTTGLVVTGVTAVAAAIAVMSYSAESSQRTLIRLQDTLRGTRDDYISLGKEVNQASRNVAATSTASVSDARSAGATIAGSPQFSGSQQQLEDLIRLSNDLATSWGIKVPEAAKVLTDAMANPAKVADDMAKKHLPEMDAELARTIERMANAGDQAGAYGVIIDKLKERHDRASESMTPLQRALDETAKLFTSTSTSGSSWGDVINQSVADVITHFNTLIKKFQEVRQAAKDAQTAGNTGAPTPGTTPIPTTAEPFDSTVGQLPSVQTRVADAAAAAAPTQQPDTRLPGLTDAMKNLALDAAKAVDQFNISMEKAVDLVKASPFGKLEDASDSVANLTKTLDALGPRTDDNAKSFDTLSLALRIAQKSFDDAGLSAANYFDTATDKSVKAIEAQAAGQRGIAEAYGQGNDAVVQATAYAKAYEAAISQGLDPASDKFTDTVIRLTVAHVDLARAIGAVKAAEEARNIADQIELIKAETNAIISNTAANRDAVQAVKDKQAIDKLAVAGATPNALAEASAAQTAADYYAGQKSLAQQAATAAEKFKPADVDRLLQQNKDFAAELDKLGARTDDNAAKFDLYTNAIKGNDAAIAKLNKTHETHVATLIKQQDKLTAQTDAQNQLTVAYGQGGDAVLQITAQLQAQEKAISDNLTPGTEKYRQAVARLTQEELAYGKAQAETKAVQESNDIAQQIRVVQAETSSLLENSDQRELMIQHMKDEYEIRTKNLGLSAPERAALLAQKDLLAQNTQEMNNNKQAASYLAQQFSSAFDTIGNAIDQAFTQGSGSAVKWGSVMQSVLNQVLQQFAHLVILNPILNSLFGQNNTTIGSIGNLLSGGSSSSGSAAGVAGAALKLVNLGNGQQGLQLVSGGGGGGVTGAVGGGLGLIGTQAVGTGPLVGGGINDVPWDLPAGAFQQAAAPAAAGGGLLSGGSSLLSAGGSIYSIGQALFPQAFSGGGIGGMFSGVGESLGLTGSGGLLSGVTGLLNTPLISGVAAGQFGPVTSGLAEAGAGLPAGLTVGSLIGGVGAGYGLGSLAGSYIQSSLGKVGPAPEIGAATGAIAGAVIGSVVPVIGTLAGALIGGVIGGGGGGLIGPKAPSAFSSTRITVNDQGLLNVGGTTAQRVDASAERSGAISDAASINNILTNQGLRIASLEGANTGAQYLQIGQNTPGGFQDPSKYANFGAAFPSLRFSSQDPLVGQFIQGRSFASPDELSGVTTSLTDFENALKGTKAESDTIGIAFRALAGAANTDVQPRLQEAATFITSTYPTLAVNPFKGSLQTAQEQVVAQYGPALAEARKIGFGESDLQAAADTLMAKNTKAATDATDQMAQSAMSRYLTAHATVTGSPQDALQSALYSSDINAAQQRTQISDNLKAIWGDAYETTQGYADRMAQVDKASAEERLAILTDYNQKQYQVLISSQQQDWGFNVRQYNAENALYYPSDPGAARAAKSVSDATEQQNLYLSLTSIYGDAYTATVDYANKMAALQKAQNEESLVLEQQLAQSKTQFDNANMQMWRGLSVRQVNADATATGNPFSLQWAATYSLQNQQASEMDNFKLGLRQAYGDAYTNTQEYWIKVGALVDTQTKEMNALAAQQAAQSLQLNISYWSQANGFLSRTEAAQGLSGGGTIAQTQNAQRNALARSQETETRSLPASLIALGYNPGDYWFNYQVDALKTAQTAETAALEHQIAMSNRQTALTSQQQNAGFDTRYENAAAQVSGGIAAQNKASLDALDAQAQAEMDNLKLSLVQTYGDAYATTKDYSDKITALTKAQGEERLALQQQQNDALKSQATQSITALNQYAIGLQTSDKSPYSPQAQLTLARDQFTTQAALAAGGNFAAVQTLQQYSDAYLAAAHTVFGSGVDYVKAFGQVITALATVGAETPDTLTASILQTETRTQTQILVEQLQELQDEVHQLRLQVQQGTAAPARVAVN